MVEKKSMALNSWNYAILTSAMPIYHASTISQHLKNCANLLHLAVIVNNPLQKPLPEEALVTQEGAEIDSSSNKIKSREEELEETEIEEEKTPKVEKEEETEKD